MIYDTNLAVGQFFFRHRSLIPLVFYPLAILILFLNLESTLTRHQLWLAGIGLLVSFIGVVIRMLVLGHVPRETSGRNRKRQKAGTLNTTGIYSLVRHPLYLGNYFMWLGLIIYVGNIWFLILASILYWVYYERIMLVEENFLLGKFGEEYRQWAQKVPAVIPDFKHYKKPTLGFCFVKALKWEYRGIAATLLSFALIDVMKYLAFYNQLQISPFWAFVALVAVVFFLLIHGLRKFTHLLDTPGR